MSDSRNAMPPGSQEPGAAPADGRRAAAPRPNTPPRRPGSLPSLAELGAFDLPDSSSPGPRRSGRLTDEDLRGLPARAAGSSPAARQDARPSDATAASPRAHDATAGRVVKPVSWPGLRPQPSATSADSATTDTRSRAEPGAAGAGPAPARADAASLAPAGVPGGAGGAAQAAHPREAASPAARAAAVPARKVPAVTVGWADLQAAVAAGWMTRDAAHALWARWLARKPLSHIDAAEGEALQAPRPPGGGESTSGADGPDAGSAGLQAGAGPAGGGSRPDGNTGAPRAQPEAAQARRGPEAPRPGRQAAGAAPPVAAAEVLEPLHEARARAAAERGDRRPRIEVVDVIEVPSLAPAENRAPAGATVAVALALLAATAAAVCIAIGATLFGPWGGVAAGLGGSALAWRTASGAHRRGQATAAVLGVHLLLPLLAATVWQAQAAAGWWPAQRPLDLFAAAPAGTPAAIPQARIDWRWLALTSVPLMAAVYWLGRLRQPVLLASVTVLLWAAAYLTVGSVLQSLGLGAHGMSTFTVLLGGLTLAAALYIDLRVRGERGPDFARWPYLAGAALLGAGWVSMAGPATWMLLLRYGGWTVFVLWALSLQRLGMVAVALTLAGFELAWAAGRLLGSDLAGLIVGLLALLAIATALTSGRSRLDSWSGPLRAWMPASWRRVYVPTRGPSRFAATRRPG